MCQFFQMNAFHTELRANPSLEDRSPATKLTEWDMGTRSQRLYGTINYITFSIITTQSRLVNRQTELYRLKLSDRNAAMVCKTMFRYLYYKSSLKMTTLGKTTGKTVNGQQQHYTHKKKTTNCKSESLNCLQHEAQFSSCHLRT